jgi:hypothetical protein
MPPKSKSSASELPEIVPSHLVVKALQPGFRRSGRAWPAEETTVAVDDFTAEQIEALFAEPLLVVVPLVAAEEKPVK